MANILVLGLENQVYSNKSGKIINKLICHYFDFNELHASKLERGYRLLNQDVIDSYSPSDFPFLPGFYSVSIRPIPSPGGKTKSRFVGLKALSKIEIPEDREGYLLLGAKGVKDYQVEDGKVINGIKLFYIDPLAYSISEEFFGYIPMSGFLQGFATKLPSFPHFCNFDFSQIRGRNGEAMLKIIASSFQPISSFEINFQEAVAS